MYALEGDITDGSIATPVKEEVEKLLAKVKTAISNSTSLHSPLNATSLLEALAKYEGLYLAPGFGDDETPFKDRLLALGAPAIADIFDAPGGSTIDPVKAHWDSFLTSDHGLRIQSKTPNKTLNFHGKMKASDFLAQPGDLSEAQARARAAADYYHSDNALPRNIDLVRDLKRQVAAGGSPLLVSDVDDMLTSLGVTVADLGLTPTLDGKAYLKEAFAAIKGEGSAFEAALAKNTATMKDLRSQISAAK